MRLTTVFLIAFLVQLSAATLAQKVSINLKNASLKTAIREIKSQTGYDFVYQESVFESARPVTIKTNKQDVLVVLKEIFENQPLTYELRSNTVIVKAAEKSFLDDVIARFQAINVVGQVVDEQGMPLPGVTIRVKGTDQGTISSNSGGFFLKNVEEGAVIVFNYIGYKSLELPAKKDLGSVVLELADSKLDEVQVIAYGTTSRRFGNGNVSTVKAADIEKSPVANPLLAIQGRIPGVVIQQSAGVPGSGVKITIQGENSIRKGSDPFYVIDGVPYTSQMLPGLTEELGQSGTVRKSDAPATNGNPLNFINPQDIESIDVLKDADATAIYGSRAANGAILITTKKGKAGNTSVNFNLQQGFGAVSKRLELMSTEQYVEMRREAYQNAGQTFPSGEIIPGAYDLTFWDQHRFTDWQKELIGGTANYTNLMASVTGGNSNTQFLLSGGFQKEGTVTPGDLKDQKASLHFNLNNVSENKRFKLGFSGSYVYDDNKLAGVNGLVNASYNLPPNAPKLYNEDGTLNWETLPSGFFSFPNPLSGLYNTYLNKTNNLVANATAGYEIITGLNLSSNFGYNSLQSKEINTNPIGHLSSFIRNFIPRSAQFNWSQISSWIIEPQLTFRGHLGPGQLDALLGFTIQQESRDRERLNATGFSSDQTLFNIKAATSVSVDGSPDAVILSKYKYNAIFGRLSYNLKDKYIINGSVRRDGSSRFGKENRFNNFAAIGGAWIFSSERFLKDSKWLSFGKLRASYGTTGNDQIGDYTYLDLYNLVRTEGTPYQGVAGLEPDPFFFNPYLQWEETKKFSTTLDIGVLQDRILLSTTYFRNQSSNQLLLEPMPTITGGIGAYTNLPAKVLNSGVEFSVITTNIKTEKFSWTSSFNLTVPKSKMFSYQGPDDARDDFNGKSLNTVRAYKFLGVDEQTGLYLVADKDGNPTSTPDPASDMTEFIDLNQKFYGGFQNGFTYRNFSLDFLIQFAHQIGADMRFGYNTPGSGMQNQPLSVLDRWRQPGDKKQIQKYSTDFTVIENNVIANQSDRLYSDASYLRLKNVSLGYQLPLTVISKAGLQRLRVYAQGQNLLTASRYKGLDPENRSFLGLPPLRVMTIGLQVGL